MSSDSPPEQPLGGGMIIAAWIGLLIVLVMVFNNVLDKRDNPNQNVAGHVTQEGVNEVTLRRNPMGHYLASGEINDHPVRYLLDTGATMVAVPEQLASELGLERGQRMTVNTANGLASAWSTRIDTVRLGNIELHNVYASINPGMQSDEILLGMSFLRKLEFTQRGNELTLRQYPGN